MFVIGLILKPQGLKGDVKVLPATDDPNRFKLLGKARVEFENGRGASYDIEHVWMHKKFIMLKFKGVDSADEADKLRGGRITVTDQEAVPLEADEYFVRDLYDMAVVTDSGEYLGTISDVLETGGADVYVVRPEAGADILIPAVKQYILSVDVKARVMAVRLAEGMR